MGAPRVVHVPAAVIGASHIGQRMSVTFRTKDRVFRTISGGLSDVEHFETSHRTFLWIGGNFAEVRNDTTVTIGDLDVLGGVA